MSERTFLIAGGPAEITEVRINGEPCAWREISAAEALAVEEAYQQGRTDMERVMDERHWDYLRGNVIAALGQ